MYSAGKLKSEGSVTALPVILGVSVVIMVLFAGILAIFGMGAAYNLLFIIMSGLGLLYLGTAILTRSGRYLVPTLTAVLDALFFASLPGGLLGTNSRDLMILFGVCAALALVWNSYLVFTRKLKWRGREVLELAAVDIEAAGNGYTGRPRPVGRVEYSQAEIMDFARFALRHFVAVSYVEPNRVVLVPVGLSQAFIRLFGLKRDYSGATWVSFDLDGNVSVNISRQDYYAYKENLAFDRLCESLGNLFIEFLGMYVRGEGVRIVDRMDVLKLSPLA